ncbi:MarR family winged helix-turn-helix transcriptional regulator [Merdibacter massiliensis]|uniref:MarR family winged helix-turn-helix transcriptional regulator n=1 Tax=Merdibacter massiliensis TaxID=1871030 RepID=UPI00096A6817|nr:MarR family transcriptional regulator [Merdibacter massiliensis]
MQKKKNGAFKAISIIYRKTHMWMNGVCAGHDLTSPQAMVLLIVCDHEMLTQDEITKRLNLDKSVIAKTVTKLVHRNFLKRTTNKKDKRTYDISPTEKAWEVYPFLKQQMEHCFDQMTQKMTKEQKEQFLLLLEIAAQAALDMEEPI